MNHLYHYCSTETFAALISGRSLWLSSLSLSNDTMEGKVLRATIQSEIEKHDLNAQQAGVIHQAFKSLEEIMDGLGFCLSEQGDLLSQWRGYANNGQGLSIGFSKEYLEALSRHQEEGRPGFSLKKVIYDEREQVAAVEPVVNEIIKQIEAGHLEAPRPPTSLLSLTESQKTFEQESKRYEIELQSLSLKALGAFNHLFILKNPAFSEEQEWRLLSHTFKVGVLEDCEFRPVANRLIPYRVYELKDIGIPAIGEVILGPRNTTPEYVVQSILKKYGFENVAIQRSSATYR